MLWSNSAVAPSEMHTRVKKWADRLKIGDLLAQAPRSLSGGQKQRVAMAGVLIDEGDILLFDEPLASLDPATGEASVDLINELHQTYHVTEVIIEHRLEDVLRRPVDRLVVMKDGRIIADDAPETLFRMDSCCNKSDCESRYTWKRLSLRGLIWIRRIIWLTFRVLRPHNSDLNWLLSQRRLRLLSGAASGTVIVD